MHWNAQGITTQSKALQLELFAIQQKIDVILLTETYLNDKHSLQLANFTVYRNDRATHAGGVAIAIHNKLKHTQPSILNTNFIENLTIEISLGNIPISITVAYSPRYNLNFVNDIKIITSASKNFVILGDLNAKHTTWNCVSNNTAGNCLYRLLQTSEFMLYHTNECTHYPHSGSTPSTIDVMLTNTHLPFELTALTDHLNSDHAPIICRIDAATILADQIQIFDYSKTNWNRYATIITDKIQHYQHNRFETPQSIDNAIEILSLMIEDARKASTPTIIRNQKHTTISSFTKHLIQTKNSAKRRWQRCNDPQLKAVLLSTYKKLQDEVNSAVDKDRNIGWSIMLNRIKKGERKLWQLTKMAKAKKADYTEKISIDRFSPNPTLDRANKLAKFFESSHKLTIDQTQPFDDEVANTVSQLNLEQNAEINFNRLSTSHVSGIIGKLQPYKSAGPDGILNLLLKKLPPLAIKILTNIFNACITIGHWPTSYKHAKIIPILKDGKPPTEPSSYRPISLLNTIGKILEKITHQLLLSVVNEKGLLPNEQFGFREQHSTVHQVKRILNHIKQKKADRKSTGMILLDIEKAFDTVWHDGLIFKLHKMKIPRHILRLINSFIRLRSFSVHINDSYSVPIRIPAGVPQGTCLSPLLFTLYISDLPRSKNTHIALFADDTGIYSSSNQSNVIVKRLNIALKNISDYFQKWKIKANVNKTQAIIFPFDNKRKRQPTLNFECNGTTIDRSKSVKYLGVTLDSKLNFGEHITKSHAKASRCFGAVYTLLAPKSNLSIENKRLIYTAVIRPIISYASPIWNCSAQTHLMKLYSLQNKILKIIHKLPRRTPTVNLQINTGIAHLAAHLNQVNEKFSLRTEQSKFQWIRDIII